VCSSDLLLALALRPELHLTAANALLCLPALALAWALRFFWGLWLAELAFWSTRADALLVIQDSLVFVFSGLVAPVVLLPEALQGWARLLPFRYMVGFPVEILTGQLEQAEILAGLGVQAGWLAAALALAWLLWRAGVKRYTAIGS
jgi:ABC-2 type transport system permease protein